MREPLRILNIDDDEAARYVKSRVLTQAGYEVIEAANAVDGLAIVRNDQVHLALVDVKLPDISGLDLCRLIKTDPKSRSIPVIQISAVFVSELDELIGLAHGADMYLRYPLDPLVLTTVVETIVKLLRANSAVLEQEERTRNLIRQATVGIAQCDLAGRFVQVNERFCQMIGYSFLDLRDKTFLDVTHPEDRDASRQLFEQMARHGLTSYRVEKRFVHENGSVVHVDNFSSLINTVDGQRLGAIHVILDVTDRKVPRSSTRH